MDVNKKNKDQEVGDAKQKRTDNNEYNELTNDETMGNGVSITPRVFCEMDQLFFDDDDDWYMWKEVARWVKFEEVVEKAGRWSKPHVASLLLNSVQELTNCIQEGTMILDCKEITLSDIYDTVVTSWTEAGLDDEKQHLLIKILNQDHHHQYEQGLQLCTRRNKSRKDSTEMANRDNSSSSESGAPLNGNSENKFNPTADGSPLTSSAKKCNKAFKKKIQPGSVAANILIGGVDFLKKPFSAFVRLHQPMVMTELTEIDIPSRFIFILLGPESQTGQLYEMGRAMATLLSDEAFHPVAFHAETSEDFVKGINGVVKLATVLPPGEWNPAIRVEPPANLQQKKTNKKQDKDEEPDTALIRTGRLFGGLVADVKRKVPFYLSDFRDALSIQCLASVIFLYFACLSALVTFGGILGNSTENYMASFESILAAGIVGCTFHLFCGQPLLIVGNTGPVLAFEAIVYQLCKEYGFEYLPFRCCIGLWTMVLFLIIVAFDLSSLVRFITRFTGEGFAVLTCAIFIYQAIKSILAVEKTYPVRFHAVDQDNPMINQLSNCTCVFNTSGNASQDNSSVEYSTTTSTIPNLAATLNGTSSGVDDCVANGGTLAGTGCGLPQYVPDVFFFSVLLFIGTIFIAINLKSVKTSTLFTTKIRSVIGDFAVVLSIGSMVALDILVGLDTPKLLIPDEFRTTRKDRPWVINPLANAWWTILVAILPAALATILVFLGHQITAVIINRKENKFKACSTMTFVDFLYHVVAAWFQKGYGYHLDLLVIALLLGLCSVLGLPWLVAAPVLTFVHVNSLKKESKCAAPGEKPHFGGIIENRLTGFLVFLLIEGSLVFRLTSVLKNIPLPVLYGVFFYMGFTSLKGIQLIDRIIIMFVPPKLQPDTMFLRQVRTWRVHLFTVIQIICLTVLWVIKSIKEISILFPIMILALAFIRRGLDWIFSQEELKLLDDQLPNARERERQEKNRKNENWDDNVNEEKIGSEPEKGIAITKSNKQIKHRQNDGNIDTKL